MSTWNTEPPNDTRDVLIRGECGDSVVAYYEAGFGWEPVNVQANCNDAVEHNLVEPIVWQELPK